nr:retrovirus-related Pol polyprotein from transposon opus [Tanacetum cinerariifolium]
MAKEDEEKTSFHTEQRMFFYEKMPFGLKNVRATYQRLMDNVFVSHLGRNIEIYVEDVAGQFLGYMITNEGIQANPEKVQAIINMASPRTLREVQALNGKLAALGRFLAKSTERSLAFFKTLKESPTLDSFPREDDTKTSQKRNEPAWTLFTDGASSIEGSGEGLILTDPDGREVTYALRFNFKASNNEAEYEALVAGLELVIQMEAQQLNVYTDSLLIANQVKGIYEAREELIKRKGYLTPWLRCVGPEQTNYVLREAHFRSCGAHAGAKRLIVSDNGKQFSHNPFREWCEELKIKQNFTSVAHPQANGQTEVTNRTILPGLKERLGKAKGKWVEELPNALWAYRTTARAGNRCTPFSLVYGSEAVLPPELGLSTYRISNFDPNINDANLRLNLDLLEEIRELASLRNARYKAQTEKYYNNKVKHNQFKIGDFVLRRNEASRQEGQRKPGPNWEGPYQVTSTKRAGTYILADMNGRPVPRTWHSSNLRKFRF